MMKKKVVALMCVAAMTMGIAACGNSSTADTSTSDDVQTEAQAADTETEATEEEAATGYVFATDLLYNDADELVDYVPYSPTGSSYAEAMMQVTGYTYTFDTDGTNYTVEIAYECGTPGADTTMYMGRTFTFTGTCTADGDVYTLDAPEHFTMTQETAGQFAATSGEGGADYWGPNGLTIDETYTNEEGYAGVNLGADTLAAFSACTATVSGDTVIFAALEGADSAEAVETTEAVEATEAE